MVAWSLLFGVSFCILLALAFLTSPLYTTARSVSSTSSVLSLPMRSMNGLPWVPQTVEQAHAMDPLDFELLSAAVVIAMGQGHSFYSHTGQSGDQGVDAKLLNINNLPVIVQSKRYAEHNHIAPEQILSFWGAIYRHNAIYGYFVTTSTLSVVSQQIVDAGNCLEE